MLEQMLANRRIEKIQCNIKKCKDRTEICNRNEFWDRNLGLESNTDIA